MMDHATIMDGDNCNESKPLLPPETTTTRNVDNNAGNNNILSSLETTMEDSSSAASAASPTTSPEEQSTAAATETTTIKIELSSWIRLILFFIGSVVAGGIIPGQNVYSQLFCERAGLFSYACRDNTDEMMLVEEDGDIGNNNNNKCCSAQWLLLANTMNGLSVLIYIFFFMAGLLFDSIGGRYAAVYGCVVNAGGFFVLALLFYVLQSSATNLSPVIETVIFCFGVILVDAGSVCTNVSFYGFLWHLPSHQALILSLANCCLNVAALIPLVLRYVMDHGSKYTSLATVFAMYAGVVLLFVTPICWYTVPSIEQYRTRAMDVLGVPIPRRAIKNGLRGAIQNTKSAIKILKVHTKLHIYTMIASLFTWLVSFIYMTMANPLGSEIFKHAGNYNTTAKDDDDDQDAGSKFATLYNQSNALLGLFVGPLVGVLVDRVPKNPASGLIDLAYALFVSLAVLGMVCGIPNWKIQTVAVSVAALNQIITLLFVNRYSVVFSPPNRLGAVSGTLVAVLGIATFIPLMAFSVVVALYGSYVKPTMVMSFIGTVSWLLYIIYVKRTKQLPDSPVFLPEDELEVAKTFGVGTLDDAAYVAGKTTEEFKRLSSSSNVFDQKKLLDSAFTKQAGERMIEVAKRRSSNLVEKRRSVISAQKRRSSTSTAISAGNNNNSNSNNALAALQINPEVMAAIDAADDVVSEDDELLLLSNEPPQYPIPTDLVSGYVERYKERYVIERCFDAKTASEIVVTSFNGHGGYGGRSEPSIDWIMSSVGPPDTPLRIAAAHSIFDPMAHCAESYGTILTARVVDEEDEGNNAAATCICFHPDALEKGKIMETGSDRYFYSLAASGAAPVYMDRQLCGPQLIQRWVGFMQDSQWDEKRKEYGPIWYVACLATHPKYQGRSYAKKLLSVIFTWADRDKVDVYLECSESNVPYYEKCGFVNTSKGEVTVDGTTMYNFIMVRKYK